MAAGITNEYPIMRHMMNLETVLTYEGTRYSPPDYRHGCHRVQRLFKIWYIKLRTSMVSPRVGRKRNMNCFCDFAVILLLKYPR